jgi:hypothetical protein
MCISHILFFQSNPFTQDLSDSEQDRGAISDLVSRTLVATKLVVGLSQPEVKHLPFIEGILGASRNISFKQVGGKPKQVLSFVDYWKSDLACQIPPQ